MTPELEYRLSRIVSLSKRAFHGPSDGDTGADPMQAESPDPDVNQIPQEQEPMPQPQLPPEVMARLKQHLEDHRLMQEMGMDGEQAQEPKSYSPLDEMTKESEEKRKKIYRYIKGKRRGWYEKDLKIEKRSQRVSVNSFIRG